jgi:DNA-binding NarL/FixJ family response regulator
VLYGDGDAHAHGPCALIGVSEEPAGLTQREVEVLRLVARGLSNKQIAEQLVISPKTVANHVEQICSRIAASTRARASLFGNAARPPPEEQFAAASSAAATVEA